MKPLLSSNIAMEEFESDLLCIIPDDLLLASELADAEKRFLNGLIRYHRPERILEIGVARGGTSLIILNAIQDNSKSSLTSIDIAHTWYRDNSVPIGEAAKSFYANDNYEAKWRLITGKDPVEMMDSLDSLFDFCIIDTSHLHPAESLNFLTVLPYLTGDAIVVLHDISMYAFPYPRFKKYHATKLLYDCVVADKLLPKEEYSFFGLKYIAPNIGAFQITDDTKKYIGDVFSMLGFRWDYSPTLLDCFYEYFKKHYNRDCVNYYERALRINSNQFCFEEIQKLIANSDKVIFYGAGWMCRAILELFMEKDWQLPCEIWDINADKLEEISTVPVVLPRFDSSDELVDCLIVITILDKSISESVRQDFQKAGFSNLFIWNDIDNK